MTAIGDRQFCLGNFTVGNLPVVMSLTLENKCRGREDSPSTSWVQPVYFAYITHLFEDP